jgi:alkanesulfonate monooxygenase SsuD/methylene tetrahydromethanopterin reductase-like flavin-dependent oxidoreductase (luciferase family)
MHEQEPRDQREIDYDAVASTLPVESPEQAADGLRALMENPAFRQLVQQVQSGELNDDELR